MTQSGRFTGRIRKAATLWIGVFLLCGCHGRSRRVEPVSVANTAVGPMTIAVAPALNLSGSADFDRDRVADLMASEMSFAAGVTVIPVSRVLGVLSVQGLDGVRSQTHALELVGLLGADAILVFSVTEYDPYDPPSMGISAQLFGTRPDPSGAVEPIKLSRQAGLAASPVRSTTRRVLAQTQRVFDASHQWVVADIRRFAAFRDGDESPFGWRKYVVSQQHFIRYCCHATLRALLNDEFESDVEGSVPGR